MAKRTCDNWRRGGNGLWLPEHPGALVPRGMGRLPATVREWGGGCFAGCCETEPPACNCDCDACSDTAPCCWIVTFTGMSNDGCNYCNNLNTTWYLSQDTPSGCAWSTSIALGCLGTGCHRVELILTPYLDGSDYKIKVELKDEDGTLENKWEKSYGATAPDCCNLGEETLTHVTSSGQCSSASATCIIAPADDNPCPSGCYTTCTACLEGIVPPLVQLTISGLANGSACTGCANANGTWTLEYVGVSDDIGCYWQYSALDPDLCNTPFPGAGCNGIKLSFGLKDNQNGTYLAQVRITQRSCTGTGSEFGAVIWKTITSATDIDCETLSITSWDDYAALNNGCDASGATVTVTAI